MKHALRRLVLAATLAALSAATLAAGSAWAQDAPSGSGEKDAGESASAWHDVLAFLGWILLALVVAGLLVWMVIGRRAQPAAATGAEPAAPPPASSTPPPAPPPAPPAAIRRDPDARELTVLTFDHVEGAERAYADARGRAGNARWLEEVAFVECHRHDRIVVRGTFAGHYLDVDDVADAIGHDTAAGAVAGAVVGLAFGPPGIAAGLVAGGIAGGVHEAAQTPEQRGTLFDEIRRDIPSGSSGLVLLVDADDSAAVIEALHDRAVRVTRHRLSADEAAAFRAAVAETPPAAPPAA